LAPSPRTELVEELYGQTEDQATSSWVNAAKYYKKWINKTAIMSYPSWNQVNAAREARNAVIHGLGKFTSRQVRRGILAAGEPRLAAAAPF